MNLKEHDNNQYTKESTEIEKYLIRIIQRYFDIENNYTKESIEAIIVESLARFKQIMITEKGFMFSLNNKTGHIVLTIKDFGGEELINKKTAFNKDFGTTDDTICEGNDERLSDEREPLQHVHDILSVDMLKEALADVKQLENVHFHNNQKLINMLTYAGTQVEIDLIILEQLERTIDNYCSTINGNNNNIKKSYDNAIDAIVTYKTIMITELNHIQELAQKSKTWINEISTYTDTEIYNRKSNFIKNLPRYLSKKRIQELKSFIKKSYYLAKSEEVLIPKGTFTCNPCTVGITDDGLPYGASFIQEESNFIINIGDVNNFRPKLYFRYEDKNSNIQTFPLPFYTENGNRKILIDANYDSAGNVYITSKSINKINYYGDSQNFYDNETLIIPSRNSSEIYENAAQNVANDDCKIALIDSKDKNDFVKNLLFNNTEYYIQGYNFAPDGPDYVDDTEQILTYTDWDTGEPNALGLSSNIKYNANKKWAYADGASEQLEYIVEYKIKPLSAIYNNPRIYCQTMGNKEGL